MRLTESATYEEQIKHIATTDSCKGVSCLNCLYKDSYECRASDPVQEARETYRIMLEKSKEKI